MADSIKPNANAVTLTFNGVTFRLTPTLPTGSEGHTNLSILPNCMGEFTRINLTSFTGTLCVFKSSEVDESTTSPKMDELATVEDEEVPTPENKGPHFVSPPPGQKQLPFGRKRRTPSSASKPSISTQKIKKNCGNESKPKKHRNVVGTKKKPTRCNLSPLESFFTTLGQSTTQLSQSSTEDTVDPETDNREIKSMDEPHPISSVKKVTERSVLDGTHYEEINAQNTNHADYSTSDMRYLEEDNNSNTIMEFDDENSVPGPEMTTSTIIEYAPKFENELILNREVPLPSSTDKIIPCARWGHSMVLIDNSQLLVYGGEAVDPDGNNLKTLSDIHVYDLPKQKWTKPINCEGMLRAWHSVTFLPDRQLLIAIGGESIQGKTQKTTTMEKLMVLDTEIMLWYPPSISGVAPSACSGHTATLLPITNNLVVFGGVKNNRWKNNIAVLDTQCWSWKVPKVSGLIPRARSDHTVTLVSRSEKNGNLLVLFGGKDGTKSFNSVHVLDTTHDNNWSWSHPIVSGTSPSPRSGHSATLLEDNKTILIYGGWDPHDEDSQQSKNEDTIYGDAYLLDTESWIWRPGPKPKFVGSSGRNGRKNRVGHSAVLAPGVDATEVMVFGGRLPEDEFACDFQTFTISRRMLQQRKR